MQLTAKNCFPDINADLGEQMGNDDHIMPYISSCNIACGGHAGDSDSIQKTVELALTYQVKIGAHPSYPDAANFGRKHMVISRTELEETLLWQIHQIKNHLDVLGEPLHHVKLHGALYNEAAVDASLAAIIIALLKDHFPTVALYAPFASQLATLGTFAGVSVIYEVFSDRRYQDDYSLVPRAFPNACIKDWEEIRRQVLDMVDDGRVRTQTGNWIPIQAETICVHGDHQESIFTAMMLNKLFCTPNNDTA
jgi:5-oxoprolinase (ATP-hydrolysing) subunit A